MSYQIKFIQDCIAIAGLLFLCSAAHLYQQEKRIGNKLTFEEVITHTCNTLLHSVSTFFLTTGNNLASLEKQTIPHRTHTTVGSRNNGQTSHTKEIQALNKQINFIKQVIATDTLLSLSERNLLTELIKECEAKIEHLSFFIKKSLIEHDLPDHTNTENSIKLFESYVAKKVTAIGENVLNLTLLFYKTMTGKEYQTHEYSSIVDILTVLKEINKKIKPFIV